jgi:hypothetical protein
MGPPPTGYSGGPDRPPVSISICNPAQGKKIFILAETCKRKETPRYNVHFWQCAMFKFLQPTREVLNKVEALEKRLITLEERFSRVTADVLDATERLERVTRRAFRLREQLAKLEENPEPQQRQFQQEELANPDLKRQALLKRWMTGGSS